MHRFDTLDGSWFDRRMPYQEAEKNHQSLLLMLEWSRHAELTDIFTMGVDVLCRMRPERDVRDGVASIELDSGDGAVVTIPHALYLRTMAYVYGAREAHAGALPRQAAFITRFGDRYTLASFWRELRGMLSET